MEKRSSGYFRFKEGTLYPALHRLEEGGLVEGKWGQADPAVPRRYYHITPRGKRMLEERLSEWQRFASAVNSVMQPQTQQHLLRRP